MSPVFGKLFGREKKEEAPPPTPAKKEPEKEAPKDATAQRLDFTAERQRIQQEEARRRFLEKMKKAQEKEEDVSA